MTSADIITSHISHLNKDPSFPRQGELAGRITDLIDEYSGELSLAGILGILKLESDQRSFRAILEHS
jgi:hypothetical protein